MALPIPDLVPYRQDATIWPVLESLAACLCSELAASDLPDTCFCGIFAGEVATDYVGDGDQGQAWVRVVGVFPSAAFPTPDPGSRLSCDSPLAAELEVGVMRCAPPSTEGGLRPPSHEAQWEAARLQMADMAAMRRAVRCCNAETSLVRLGRYSPAGPMGGVVGGTWQVFVAEATTPRRVARRG